MLVKTWDTGGVWNSSQKVVGPHALNLKHKHKIQETPTKSSRSSKKVVGPRTGVPVGISNTRHRWSASHRYEFASHQHSFMMMKDEYGPVTMVVRASGHQVRCIPWVQMGTFNKEIGFLCGSKFFALNIFCGEYPTIEYNLMLQIWWKPLLWKMCQ